METSETPTSPGPRTGAKVTGRGPFVARPSVLTRWAVGLVIGGVLAMVLPGLLRDGVCGLVACSDVTPEVAVGRPGGNELAVVVPEGAAGELRSLRLFPVNENTAQDTAGAWIVYREDPDAAPQRIEVGSQPEGFATRTELAEQPAEGLWVLDASFGCASTLVRFAPEELDPGFVTTGDAPVPIQDFEDGARSTLRCATEAPAWQRWLFMLGALAASVGAVLGIWVVLRGPVREDPEWYAPEDQLD